MTYYDLTIDKYLQIKEVLEDATDDLSTQVALMSVLNECTEDELLDMPLEDFKEKQAELAFLAKAPDPKPNCPKTITIAGKAYEAVRDIKQFTAGQYIDYQNLIKTEDIYSVLHNLLAVFFIPKGKDYGKDYDIMEVAETIKHNVSIGFALDVCFFFQRKSIRLINSTLDSLVLMTKMNLRKQKDKKVKEKLRTALMKLEQLRDSFRSGVGGITLM